MTDRINVHRRLLRAILVADLMVLGAVGGLLAWANWPARSIAVIGVSPEGTIVTPPQDTASAAGGGGPIVGKSTPDFTLKTLDGSNITLTERRGQVGLINLRGFPISVLVDRAGII